MGPNPRRLRAFGWYTAVVGTAVAVHEFLPPTARMWSYTLISATTLVPLAALVRRSGPDARRPWYMLLAAMALLAFGSWITAAGGVAYHTAGDLVVTIGHAMLLASALALVIRRGRNDVGGLIDAAVALMAFGSLLWACLLQPRMSAARTPLGGQVAVLISIFVLCGILGALGRIWIVGGRRLVALQLLVCALLQALVGNTALALASGSITSNRPAWVEIFFLIAYLCVGSAALHPSVHELARPGPAPVDRLSIGRLVFLGAAMVVGPLIGGARQLLGLPADGLLLALGTLAVAPFVMARIHRLGVQRERAERALLHQATHDPLTGLPNRAEFMARLTAALDRDRTAGRAGAVLLFCDLNGFKLVNDRLGHAAGDKLLVEVGRRLRTGLRAEDTVARYGGDEFLVLCEDGSPETAARLRDHIHTAVSAPIDLDGEQVRVGVSVGAVTSDGMADADELICRADALMYESKQRRHRADRDFFLAHPKP